MTIDWNDAAAQLKRDVCEHGGFLTITRDELRSRFGIGRLTPGQAGELETTLYEHSMAIWPPPHLYETGNTVRVYDIESEIGKIAFAVLFPHDVSEKALADAVRLHNRANAGKDRRSDDVPWLQAFDVFLQLVIGRPPEGWEDLEDDREPYQLRRELARSLGLPDDLEEEREVETVRIAGAVCACRPHRTRWEGAPPGLAAALTDAARRQKEIFDRVLREAAEHLLGGADIPSHNVELGRLGLRYRREAEGGIGWLR